MNYEEKYKAVLERAKECLKDGTITTITRDYIWEIFPELKDSEDEKIRKDILCYFEHYAHDIKGADVQKWLDWLEKQAKQTNVELSQKEVTKISDQELEPKFHEGEWIISNTADKDYHICKITGIKDGNYTIESICGYKGYNQFDVFDTVYKLWTIADAKDGDVLSYVTDEEEPWIMIYRSLYELYEGPVHYHALLFNDNFTDKGICYICIDNLKPTTKEQRDLLFQKMKEAGWERIVKIKN